jgi:hypothetical protein
MDSIIHIGNEEIINLNPFMFVPLERVIIEKRNCYADYNDIKQKILDIDSRYPTKKLLFYFCCSATAPILIKDLHTILQGRHYLIDMGSYFDSFLGFASRTPSRCMKQFLFDTYRNCQTKSNVNEIEDRSMST